MKNPQIIGYGYLSYLKIIILVEFLQQFGRKSSFCEITVCERMSCEYSMNYARHLLKFFYLHSSFGEQCGRKLISLRFRVSKKMSWEQSEFFFPNLSYIPKNECGVDCSPVWGHGSPQGGWWVKTLGWFISNINLYYQYSLLLESKHFWSHHLDCQK
jgi:hypothetical protein